VVSLPELDVSESLRRGELQRLLPDSNGEAAPLYAVLPSHRFTPQRVRALVDALAAHFADPP